MKLNEELNSRCDGNEDNLSIGSDEEIVTEDKLKSKFKANELKSFSCDWIGCGLEFANKRQLLSHKRCHSNEESFKCSECHKCLSSKYYLKEHQKNHKSNSKLRCDQSGCSFETLFSGNLKRHLIRRHEYNHNFKLNLKKFRTNSDKECNQLENSCEKRFINESNEKTLELSEDSIESEINEQNLNLSNDSNNSNDVKNFICDWSGCGKEYRQNDQLMAHIRRSHSMEKPFKCLECDKRFKREEYLTLHKKIHINRAAFECLECNKCFSTEKYMRRHKNIYHLNRVLIKCSYGNCPFETKFSSNLSRHYKRMHKNIRHFKCNQSGCDKSFHTKADLIRHEVSTVHSFKPVPVRTYPCEWPGCDAKYTSNHGLQEHKNHKHSACDEDIIRFYCKETNCNKSYLSKFKLKEHFRCVHRTERPFACEWPGCDQRFKTNRILTSHRLVHLSDRQFKCTFSGCHKSYKRIDALTAHRKCHSRPFVCHWPECNESFAVKSVLIGHTNRHQNIRSNKCHLCDRSYFGRKQMLQHIRESHKI